MRNQGRVRPNPAALRSTASKRRVASGPPRALREAWSLGKALNAGSQARYAHNCSTKVSEPKLMIDLPVIGMRTGAEIHALVFCALAMAVPQEAGFALRIFRRIS